MPETDELMRLLDLCSPAQRQEIFDHLRSKIAIHPLEKRLNIQAEIILEAIDRASDLTLRGVRGIITEAAFERKVLAALSGWRDVTPEGDHAFDYLLESDSGRVSIQVKMQRQERQEPKVKDGMFVVETQRTRTGKDKRTGKDTRPYRFGEFDVLAVSLQPSTGNWGSFLYTVADWLLPRSAAPHLLQVLQPVAQAPNQDWTDELEECIRWFRSGKKKKIMTGR